MFHLINVVLIKQIIIDFYTKWGQIKRSSLFQEKKPFLLTSYIEQRFLNTININPYIKKQQITNMFLRSKHSLKIYRKTTKMSLYL